MFKRHQFKKLLSKERVRTQPNRMVNEGPRVEKPTYIIEIEFSRRPNKIEVICIMCV